MTVELHKVLADEKEILRNLLEKYNYEFSQWDRRDVNFLGLYGYDWLDPYWTEENRHAFFILADGKLAGFAMINNYPETSRPIDYGMAEFCVMPKYRRMGVGRTAAFAVFDRFPGKWHLKMHPANTGALAFWMSVVREYTGGAYRLETAVPGTEFDDGSPADVLFFTSDNKTGRYDG